MFYPDGKVTHVNRSSYVRHYSPNVTYRDLVNKKQLHLRRKNDFSKVLPPDLDISLNSDKSFTQMSNCFMF